MVRLSLIRTWFPLLYNKFNKTPGTIVTFIVIKFTKTEFLRGIYLTPSNQIIATTKGIISNYLHELYRVLFSFFFFLTRGVCVCGGEFFSIIQFTLWTLFIALCTSKSVSILLDIHRTQKDIYFGYKFFLSFFFLVFISNILLNGVGGMVYILC